MSIAEKLQTIAKNESKVFEAGKKSQYDEFWDAYQENGQRTMYVQAFARQGWNDITYKPKYDIVGGSYGLQETFSNASSLKDTKVKLFVRSDGLQTTFNGCTQLVRIPSLILEVPVTKTSLAFDFCYNLEELNITCVNDGCIAGNIKLSYSEKLSHDSLMSIINALKDFATLQTVCGYTMTGYTNSIVDEYTINEGETYFLTFKPQDLWGDSCWEDTPAVVKPMYIEGVGETIGVHYETPFWAYPDDYTYNVDLYKGGINEDSGEYFLFERRYIKNEATGEIQLWGYDGDEITIKKRGTATETHTLTIGTTNLAKLTDAEQLQATEKGWELE